jgi:hypothetical protein
VMALQLRKQGFAGAKGTWVSHLPRGDLAKVLACGRRCSQAATQGSVSGQSVSQSSCQRLHSLQTGSTYQQVLTKGALVLQMCCVRWLLGIVSGDAHHHCLAGEAPRVSTAHHNAAVASLSQGSFLP